MKRFLSILLLLLVLVLDATAATVKVDVHDFTTANAVNRRVTMTLLSAGAVTAGPWLIAGDSVARFTDYDGVCYFSNVLNGGYRVDIAGQPTRSFPISVMDTNGLLDATQLIGTTNYLPAFYTAAQVDALFSTATNLAGTQGAITNNEKRAVNFTSSVTASNLVGRGLGLTNLRWLQATGAVALNPVYLNSAGAVRVAYDGSGEQMVFADPPLMDGRSVTNVDGFYIQSGTISTNAMDATAYAAFIGGGAGGVTNNQYLPGTPSSTNANLAGTFTGSFTGDAAGATNLPTGIHHLYVAPWGDDATAQRGDPLKPWGKVYEWDGITRSGVTSVATNGDTIHVLGTNYAVAVPLNNGVTLSGIYRESTIQYTNGCAFTNDWLTARGGSGPSFPYVSVVGSAVIENLIINARDGSFTYGMITDPNYISPFQCAAFGSQGTWVLDNPGYYTNNIRLYTPFTALGFTNAVTNLLMRNTYVLGNVDVFYMNGRKNIPIYNSSTNDPAYDPEEYGGQNWSAAELAMTWTTNIVVAPDVRIVLDNVIRDSLWDYDFFSGDNLFVTIIGGEGYARGYGGGAGYGSGIKISGQVASFTETGGRHYHANATNTTLAFGMQITAQTKATYVGSTFFRTNMAGKLIDGAGTMDGYLVDWFTGTTFFGGETNIQGAFKHSNAATAQTNGAWSISAATGFTGKHTGDGAGLTNLAAANLTPGGTLPVLNGGSVTNVGEHTFTTNIVIDSSVNMDMANVLRYKLGASTNVFRIMIFGDSLAGPDSTICGIPRGIVRGLIRQYGLAGASGRSLTDDLGSGSDQNYLQATSVGGAAANVNYNPSGIHDTNWWGLWNSGTSNSIVRWANNTVANGDTADHVGLWWIAYPEGTNFSFQISTNGGTFATYATLAGRASTRTLRYTNYTLPKAQYRVQASTDALGTNIFIGAEIYDTTTNGILPFYVGRGGVQILNGYTNIPASIWNGVLTNFAPDLFIYQMSEVGDVGVALTEYSLTNQILPWFRLAASNATVLLVGNTFRGDTDAQKFEDENRLLQRYARSNSFMFFDAQHAAQSWLKLTTNGYMVAGSDAIHYVQKGSDALGEAALHRMGLLRPAGRRLPNNPTAKGTMTADRFAGDGGGLSNITAQVSSFNVNGTNILWLDLTTGRDQNGVLISTSVASGPYLKNMNSYFGNYFGYFPFYDPNVTTGYRAAYYTPNWPGIITAKTFRLTAYWLATNSFAYPMQFDISSFSAGGVVQLKSSASTFSYTGGTNLQTDVRLVTFDNVPTSQPVIRYGYTGSWAITNLAVIQAISVEWSP